MHALGVLCGAVEQLELTRLAQWLSLQALTCQCLEIPQGAPYWLASRMAGLATLDFIRDHWTEATW